MLTQSRLRELLHYNPETGAITWLVGRQKCRAGSPAGSLAADGYRIIGIDGRLYRAHRLAWLYMTGDWSAGQMDHRNGVRSDNRLANLREATGGQNQQNRAVNGNNTSGFPGVNCYGHMRKWRSRIKFEGKTKCLGSFGTAEAAHAAYLAAKAELHTFNPTVRSDCGGRLHGNINWRV